MSNTYKGKMFINEPMDDKPVTDIPGIGEITASLLKEKGIEEAEDLFNVYLRCDRNKIKFRQWLKYNGRVVPKISDLVFESLDSWNKNFHEGYRAKTDDKNILNDGPSTDEDTKSKGSQLSLIRHDDSKLNSQLDLDQQKYLICRSDAIMTFFIAMAKKVSLMPINVQDQIEKQVYDIINNAKANVELKEKFNAAFMPNKK